MTADNVLVLLILFFALVLFISEKLRADIVSLLVLVALVVSGLLTIEEAFAGFANPAVITVWAVFIISGALNRGGIADLMARGVIRLSGKSPVRLTVVIMLSVGVMSAFMNNIGAVAIMLPAVVAVAARLEIPPSKLLIPLAFASLMGGNMTLIGTPPNILAVSIMESRPGIEPFKFFDFLPSGLLVLGIGTLYMALIGRHILPERFSGSEPSQAYRLVPYLAELVVSQRSSLVGKSIGAAAIGTRYALNIIQIRRANQPPFFPGAERPVQPQDILLVEGSPDQILAAQEALALTPIQEADSHDLKAELTVASSDLIEITLAPRSPFIGKSLDEIGFRSRYRLTVLALRHHGESLVTGISNIPLELGDALLVQGAREQINELRRNSNFLLLDTPPIERRRIDKAPLTVAILIGVLTVITLGWLHPSAAMLIGALLVVITGAITMDEAYASIEWKAVFLIAGILPLGTALDSTGTAALLADQIVQFTGELGPRAVMVAIFVLTALLTAVISNAAATVLVVPIAIDTALGLGVNAQTYVMAVVIAASTSFILPISHQVNIIVYGPGGYRFSDYARVGIWLNLLILIVVALALPLLWPLVP